MPENVTVVVPAAVWYSAGRPEIPRNAVLPTAAPPQVGVVLAAIAAPDTFIVKVITLPSCKVSA